MEPDVHLDDKTGEDLGPAGSSPNGPSPGSSQQQQNDGLVGTNKSASSSPEDDSNSVTSLSVSVSGASSASASRPESSVDSAQSAESGSASGSGSVPDEKQKLLATTTADVVPGPVMHMVENSHTMAKSSGTKSPKGKSPKGKSPKNKKKGASSPKKSFIEFFRFFQPLLRYNIPAVFSFAFLLSCPNFSVQKSRILFPVYERRTFI